MNRQDSLPDDLGLQLVAMLLHDLETPFAVVGQFLKRVEQGRFNGELPAHQKLLRSTTLAVQRGERILADLLEQARSEKQRLVLDLSPTDLKLLIEGCLPVVQPLAEDKQLQFEVVVHPAVAGKQMLDTRYIARVVDNFLVNAIRHAPLKSTITVHVQPMDEQIRVAVANQPIQPLDFSLLNVFDPVQQVQLRHQRKVQGSGLGLVFCKMVVEAHGGTVGAETDANGQTIFWFQVPQQILNKEKNDG